jgi:hypothetical protein
MAQIGVSLDEYEIKNLIKTAVSSLVDVPVEDLDVYVTCWNGRLSTCTVHIDPKKDLIIKRNKE